MQAYLAHQARAAFGVRPEARRVHVAQDFFRLDVPQRMNQAARGPPRSAPSPQQRPVPRRSRAQVPTLA